MFGNNNYFAGVPHQNQENLYRKESNGLVVTDNTETKFDFRSAMMRSNQVNINDFVPPHFEPDVLGGEEIIRIEKEIEESIGFEFGNGIIIEMKSQSTMSYLNSIKNKLNEGRNPETGIGKYDGTERELFSIRTMNSAQDIFKYRAVFKEVIVDDFSNRQYALFEYKKRDDIYGVIRKRPGGLDEKILRSADYEHHICE